jgi:hypothetical protein
MFDDILNGLKDGLMWFINQLINGFFDFIIPILERIGSNIPTDYKTNITAAIQYIQIANNWAPLDLAFSLLISYYMILGIMTIIKWCLKAIPGIWG